MALNPRCSGVDRKGQQCGRRVKDGSQPPLCHIHKAVATGEASPLFQASTDPVAILQKLLRDKDPAIRLRAVNAWFDYQQKQGCPTCKASLTSSADLADVISRMTTDQKELARGLIKGMHDLIDNALTQPVAPIDLPVLLESSQPIAPHLSPLTTPKESQVEESPVEEEPEPSGLPTSKWASVGLFMVNGVVTHARGDEHAQQILDGTIPYDEAAANHAAASRTHVDRVHLQRELEAL